jgi:hypothetical protein
MARSTLLSDQGHRRRQAPPAVAVYRSGKPWDDETGPNMRFRSYSKPSLLSGS